MFLHRALLRLSEAIIVLFLCLYLNLNTFSAKGSWLDTNGNLHCPFFVSVSFTQCICYMVPNIVSPLVPAANVTVAYYTVKAPPFGACLLEATVVLSHPLIYLLGYSSDEMGVDVDT